MKKNLVLGQVGNWFHDVIPYVDFKSKQSLLDLDILFLDINYIPMLYAEREWAYTAETVILGSPFFNDFLRRKRDIEDFLSIGKYLIAFTPIPQAFSDGGVRRQDNSDILPFVVETKHSVGRKISVLPKTKFTNLFLKFKDQIYYESIFERMEGTPIATVENNQAVAIFNNNVLFIPKFKFYERNELSNFLNELIEIFTGDGSIQYEIPKWSENYLLPGEKEMNSKLSDLIITQEELLEKIKKEVLLLEKTNEYKVLFTGTGDTLELIVQNLFSELGFQILEREPNRDDLIMRYNENIFVVEIKGVKGSAGENQAAQLEKWVSEYNSNNEDHAKGILVVNAFKDFEIKDRDTATFPHQMLKYSEKRDHCLISGLQLLGLYFKCKQTPAEKENLIQSLYETVGVYKGFENWNEFIEYKTDNDSSPVTQTTAGEEIK